MGLLKFTKDYTSSDDGAKLTGTELGVVQADIAAVINGGISNANITSDAAIVESKLAFDTVAGHDHDGTDSKSISIAFRSFITGAELVYVSADTIKATSGAMDINSVIYTRSTESSTIDISDDGDKIAGTSNAASTWFYIYAYNDTGTSWDIKWWNLAPQFSNCGTDTSGALIYRQTGGVWYRCIGAVYNGAGSTLLKFYQRGKVICYDSAVSVGTGPFNQANYTAVDCSAALPDGGMAETAQLKSLNSGGGVLGYSTAIYSTDTGYITYIPAPNFDDIKWINLNPTNTTGFYYKVDGDAIEAFYILMYSINLR